MNQQESHTPGGDEVLLLFGSFSESEAQYFQSSASPGVEWVGQPQSGQGKTGEGEGLNLGELSIGQQLNSTGSGHCLSSVSHPGDAAAKVIPVDQPKNDTSFSTSWADQAEQERARPSQGDRHTLGMPEVATRGGGTSPLEDKIEASLPPLEDKLPLLESSGTGEGTGGAGTVHTVAAPAAAAPVKKPPPSSWAALLATSTAPAQNFGTAKIGTGAPTSTPAAPSVGQTRAESGTSRSESETAPFFGRAGAGEEAFPEATGAASAEVQSPTHPHSSASAQVTGTAEKPGPVEGTKAGESQSQAPQTASTVPGQSRGLQATLGSTAPSQARAALGPFSPRGLVNLGNLCFANATLQALVGSTSFAHLLDDLHQSEAVRKGPYPTVRCFLEFWKDLHDGMGPQPQRIHPKSAVGPNGTTSSQAAASQPAQREGGLAAPSKTKAEAATPIPRPMSYAARAKSAQGAPLANLGPPLHPPRTFEAVLTRFSPQHHKNGLQIRQEDAQEFLSHLLDRMHEELQGVDRHPTADGDTPGSSPADWSTANGGSHGAETGQDGAKGASEEDDGWCTVLPKNKVGVVRRNELQDSAVSSIFFGDLRSELKARGHNPSITTQRFSVLQLDIAREAVRSVEDALMAFGETEYVEGYKPQEGQGSLAVRASKAVKIQGLPKVFILHLMRFTYNARGSAKLHKPVAYPLHLTLPPHIVSMPAGVASALKSSPSGKYRLFATVVHHGKEPSRGHYTADVRQEDDTWLRFDDSNVLTIPTEKVLREEAYLLLYEQT